MKRAAGAAVWILPPLLCLAVYRYGFLAWFRADDFAWLGVGLDLHGWRDFLLALFEPRSQGTIRPWSERLFFMALYGAFGLDPLPFRVIIFATQFANLSLIQWIGTRLTGSRAAGFWAAVFWVLNSAQAEPLGWTSVYNQVMCAFFLLLAFHFLLRYTATRESRFLAWQWVVFLLGFGALELNLVYPALAASYTWLYARKFFRGTLALFAPSIAYVVVHNLAAPVQKTGYYGMHFTGSVFRTLFTYWTWSVGPTFLWTPLVLPKWFLPAGVAVVTVALLGFAGWRLRRGDRLGVFCLAWYVATLAPLLPLRDHLTEYYVFIPLIGLCLLGGWGFVLGWRSGAAGKAAAAAVAALYVFMTTPEALAASKWNYDRAARVRDLVEGVAGAHQQHPEQAILLDGVDTDLFLNGILDRPFRLIDVGHVYLTPGSEQRIEMPPDYGDVREFVLPADVAARALERDELVVYAVGGPKLRNITRAWEARPLDQAIPALIDAASPLTSYLLGPEWYSPDGNHRWMPKRATLRIAGPKQQPANLYLRGNCPESQLEAGPVTVTVAVEGGALPPQTIRSSGFELAFPLPASLAGKPVLQVAVEVSRTFRPPADPRELGLAFGSFEVR